MDSSSSHHADNGAAGVLRHVHFEHMIAGVSGGIVSTMVLHPLELVKIRFQVNEGDGKAVRPAYQGIVHAMRSIVASQGIVGLYQGVTPNVFGAGITWGMYFLFYNSVKTWMQEGDLQKDLGAVSHLMIAATAGFSTLVLTNPIWVARTRMCLQYESGASITTAEKYHGVIDALLKIYREAGYRGLYKGFVPGVLGISHGSLQFMAYEQMKTLYNHRRNQPLDAKLGSLEYIGFAATSKLFASVLTYPYQVVRSRLQDQHSHYDGVVDVCQQVIRKETYRGFYKGFVAYMLHMTPNICIVFLMYEMITNAFQHPRTDIESATSEAADSV